jgi:hypothetical protein
MYQCNYKSVFRVHNVHEAVCFNLQKISEVDLFLFLLDTYDVLLDDITLVSDAGDVFTQLITKLEKFCFLNFEKLLSSIPGQMRGFPLGSFVYIIISLARSLSKATTVISGPTRTWMRKNRVRSHQSYDTSDFTISDLLDALDVLEVNWNKFEVLTSELLDYINALEARASYFISHFQTCNALNFAKHRRRVDDEGRYQISPTHIFELYVRFIAMKRSFAQYTMFDTIPSPHNLPPNRWDLFVDQENRHLSIRKFRDVVSDSVWDDMVRISDTYRASYAVRGSKVSSYQAIAVNRPLNVLDKLSSFISYGKPMELHANLFVKEALHLNLINAYFMSTFSISFRKYFFCSEQKSWDHLDQLKSAIVPLILERRKRYDVLYKSAVHLTPKNGTFAQAFVYWLLLVRRDFNGILYGSMDFNKLCSFVLDIVEEEVEEVEEGRVTKKQRLNEYKFE